MKYYQNNQNDQNNQPPYNNYYYYSPFQPPYYQPQPQPQPQPKQGQAIAALILGILALSNLSLVLAIISLCLANASKRNNNGTVLGMAKAGKICSILTIVFLCIMVVFFIALFCLGMYWAPEAGALLAIPFL